MEKIYEIEGKKYLSLEEFAGISNISEKQIIKRRKEIPVIIKQDGQFLVLRGARYPMPINRYKVKDEYKRRFILLKAISQTKYIDNKMLGIYQEEFEQMLRDLLQSDLIYENNVGNIYGANAYSCTQAGADLVETNNFARLSKLVNLAAEAGGKFIGEVLSRVYKL